MRSPLACNGEKSAILLSSENGARKSVPHNLSESIVRPEYDLIVTLTFRTALRTFHIRLLLGLPPV